MVQRVDISKEPGPPEVIGPDDWSLEAVDATSSTVPLGTSLSVELTQGALDEVMRSHISLVLWTREPSRQSAIFLRDRFFEFERLYRSRVGLPNETPPELLPFVVLSEAFGSIANLLAENLEQGKQVERLSSEVRRLQRNNEELVAAISSSKGSLLREVAVNVLAAVPSYLAIAAFTQLGGPFLADSAGALWELFGPPTEETPSDHSLPRTFET